MNDESNGSFTDRAFTSQPSHHVPYLYSLAGAASKSQTRVREIAASDYNATVNGLSGVKRHITLVAPRILMLPRTFFQNEDCGQMSAWYLFSALGFYPVNPVSGEYVVGRYVSCLSLFLFFFFSVPPPPLPSIPLKVYIHLVSSPFFDRVSIDLPSSSKKLKLDIVSPGASSKPYVRSLSINGRDLEQPIIRHDQIAQGGVLSFQMRDTPQAWASGSTFQQ